MACPLLYWSRESSGTKLLSWSWGGRREGGREGGGRLSDLVRSDSHMLVVAYHKIDV